MRVVLAIGGNALLQSGDDGTVESQSVRALESLSYILPLLISREKLLLTHGNGPQVGNALLRAEAGTVVAADMNLDQAITVAKQKGSGLTGGDIKAMASEILGVAKSMGLTCEGKDPKVIQASIKSGEFDDRF